MFIDDIRNELILYLYRLPDRGYFLVADEFINIYYTYIPSATSNPRY